MSVQVLWFLTSLGLTGVGWLNKKIHFQLFMELLPACCFKIILSATFYSRLFHIVLMHVCLWQHVVIHLSYLGEEDWIVFLNDIVNIWLFPKCSLLKMSVIVNRLMCNVQTLMFLFGGPKRRWTLSSTIIRLTAGWFITSSCNCSANTACTNCCHCN